MRKRAVNLGARQAWLWRNRDAFGDRAGGALPRLFVDVSAILFHDAQTGIQRVVRAVWSELRRRSGADFEAVPVFATGARGYCYAPSDFLEQRPAFFPQEPVRVREGDKFLGLDLSAHLFPKYRRQFRAWKAHGATIHVVVYDLLPLLRPAWFTTQAAAAFRKWFDVLTDTADQAICISDQVAEDLRVWTNWQKNNRTIEIGRLRMGADIEGSVPSTGICSEVRSVLERMESRPTILMVGTVEPRKGYDCALRAFEHLWEHYPDKAPDLVIVGKSGWKTDDIQARIRSHRQLGNRMRWLDAVSDEGLGHLYHRCRGLLMASRAEGFGLPLIEAALHRRQVLARNIPVFREQRLPNVSYFSDDSPPMLGARILDLAAFGDARSIAPASLPTWSKSVDALLLEIGFGMPDTTPVVQELRIAS
jgi:Glycosyltransferase